MDGVAILEREVRELIRRRGIDPERDSGDLAVLVREAVEDYDRRSGRGVVPTLADADDATREIVAAVAGMGPLQPYLDDPEIEEIWVNGPQRVFVARRGVPELTTTILTETQLRDLVALGPDAISDEADRDDNLQEAGAR